jgi:predicted phosphate transport protein (TIGR00153 family)
MGAKWSWLSKRREGEVISRCIKHIDKIIEETEAFIKELEAMEKTDIDSVNEYYKKVFDAERKADEIKTSIIDELSKELIHPMSREEIIRLILTSDDIANALKAAGRRLTLVRPPYIPIDITRIFLTMAEKIREQVILLKQAIELLSRDPVKSIELAEKVERLEEEIDDIRIDAELKVLKMCNEARTSLCIITYMILDIIEEASDRAEDVGDVVRSIALST